MSTFNKYNIAGCGCDGTGETTRVYGASSEGCCNDNVQTSPTPCCEAHGTMMYAGVCLKPACSVVTNAEGFFLKFSNVCDVLPIDGNNVFFYHPAAGLMQIVGIDMYGTYQLNLVDPTKAGALIEKDDCVLIAVVPTTSNVTNTRCLSGNFTAPAVNGNETIYIENGSSIPVGATLIFTANGETGSYQIVSFVSASGSTYAYTVQNTGNGHTPGTIIDGGVAGSCLVPIELITDVDLCDLSATTIADNITACENGSPRALVSTGANDILKGDGAGGWELSKLYDSECCVVISDCLKFSGDTCSCGADTVVLQSPVPSCFTDAWDLVLAADLSNGGQTNMPMNIEGFEVVLTGYHSGTRQATFEPADKDALAGGLLLSYDAGQQICLGVCCKSCLEGPMITNHKVTASGPRGAQGAAVFALTTNATMQYEAGVKHHYLVGYANSDPLTIQLLELTSAFDNNPEGGPGKPAISDPLVFRNKICHNSLKGCDQLCEIQWNIELAFSVLPAGVRVHWEVGHYAGPSATLEDGSTPNPYTSVSTQTAAAGTITGPSSIDANDVIGNTSIGLGISGTPKIFPYVATDFLDYIYLEKCSCALSMVWHYVQVEVVDPAAGSGVLDSSLAIRQHLKFFNANECWGPLNNPETEGFA